MKFRDKFNVFIVKSVKRVWKTIDREKDRNENRTFFIKRMDEMKLVLILHGTS